MALGVLTSSSTHAAILSLIIRAGLRREASRRGLWLWRGFLGGCGGDILVCGGGYFS